MSADEISELTGAASLLNFEELTLLFDRGRAAAFSSSRAKLAADLELEMDRVCETTDAAKDELGSGRVSEGARAR